MDDGDGILAEWTEDGHVALTEEPRRLGAGGVHEVQRVLVGDVDLRVDRLRSPSSDWHPHERVWMPGRTSVGPLPSAP